MCQHMAVSQPNSLIAQEIAQPFVNKSLTAIEKEIQDVKNLSATKHI
jgi:hypothetical protein